jgi:transposase
VDRFLDGERPADLCKAYPSIGISTIKRWCRNTRLLGSARTRRGWNGRIGRPRTLSPEIEADLLILLSIRPTLYLEELQYHIELQYGLMPHLCTIWRCISRKGFTKKVAQRIAKERNHQARERFYDLIQSLQVDQLVYCDESACNERTLDRKYGWAPAGMPAYNIQLQRRSTRWSVLPALIVDGYLPDPLIIQGSITAELFADWLEAHVLPHMNLFPAPRSVLIMDNCRVHYNKVYYYYTPF